MATSRSAIIDVIEVKLNDTANAIYSAASLGTLLDDALREVSQYVPLEVIEKQVATETYEFSIADIADLLEVKAIEYPVYPNWIASTAYAIDDYVTPTNWNDYSYRCTVAGTSNTTQPTWPTTVDGTVTDNTVTWTCESSPSRIYLDFDQRENTIILDEILDTDYSVNIHCWKSHHLDADWVVATAYTVGQYVSPTTQNGYRYKCTTAGTSHASTEPTWPTTVGTTKTDGTVTWTTVAEDARSLTPLLENLITDIVAARAVMDKGLYYIDKINKGGEAVFTNMEIWANDKYKKAIRKLISIRTWRVGYRCYL